MAQTSKFIDVTRTFLPINPRAYPENLHTGGGETSPEERVPVMAYRGYNFMPTAYGYKSYFGVSNVLNLDAIPAQVDSLFIYQNKAFANVLVALTATGIWTKAGSAAGAWVNTVPIAAVADVAHVEWTSVVIADSVYVYRQNGDHFYRIDSNVQGGVSITEFTPNFLNMEAQIGIFRAGGRLAFWDSDDSIAWANMNDFTDFTPSLETLAGNVKFSAIQGRIVTILSHGEGFMIYATKSIVYIKEDLTALAQWDPAVVLDSAGISYPRQVAIGSPDTTHFAATSEGIKKIENGRQESIVPEVVDVIKESDPFSYLKVIEGRYLFIESLNAGFIIGNIITSEETVPGVEYVIPGEDTELEDVVIPGTEGSECPVLDGIDSGRFPNTVPGGPGVGTPAPSDARSEEDGGPNYKPQWTCYISEGGVKDPSNIEWVAGPCPTVGPDGVDFLMSPNIPRVDALTQNATGKRAVTGAEAYIDGWTMERFVAVQTGIWEADAQAAAAVITAITSRFKEKGKSTSGVTSCTPTPLPIPENSCYLGRFAAEYSSAKFGYSVCEFWLTRYVTRVVDINRISMSMRSCSGSTAPTVTYGRIESGYFSTIEAAQRAYARYVIDWAVQNNFQGHNTWALTTVNVTTGMSFTYSFTYTRPGQSQSTGTNNGTIQTVTTPGTYTATDTVSAYNRAVDVEAAPIPETAYCTITGWTYTKDDGSDGFVPIASTCNAPALYPSNATAGGGSRNTPLSTPQTEAGVEEGTLTALDPYTGSMCGEAYEGITIDGTTTTWPDAVISMEDSEFFLQAGSNAPLYPTMRGALVYDLRLKKWGKMLQPYKHLFNYSPINSSVTGVVPSASFGILGAILDVQGKVRIFDETPAISWIVYGKVGYYRLGKTSPEEVRVDFKSASSGVIKVHTSLDGVELTSGLTVTQSFASAYSATVYGAYPGSWTDIEIRGKFDIAYLEYRGFTQGRR